MALLRFLAIVVTAVAPIPGVGHLFAMPNTLPMSAEDYFTTQQIYRGWALFAIALFGAVAANLVLGSGAVAQRPERLAGFGAAAPILATRAIFFAWTFPANQATGTWTVIPQNWEALRRQWEYSHAVNAALTFLALCLAASTPAPRRG
jgi:hypothetical protein